MKCEQGNIRENNEMRGFGFRRTLKLVEALPATSRHSKDSPWLLPSGPDQVDEIPMREDQQSPHNNGAILTAARGQCNLFSLPIN